MARNSDPYYKRAAMAPGLSEKARWALLAKWRSQGRSCTYCDAVCQAADHVIPLQRGGTNYEGNLTPCCTACNSRKSHATIMEWRMGKKPGRTYSPRPPREPSEPSSPVVKRAYRARPCLVCHMPFAPKAINQVACCGSCSKEYTSRAARNAYRRRRGLPEDWTTPAGQVRDQQRAQAS
jgi:hypothetical protein